jgi:hypothetical protein
MREVTRHMLDKGVDLKKKLNREAVKDRKIEAYAAKLDNPRRTR